jgi:phage FluMu protein Com
VARPDDQLIGGKWCPHCLVKTKVLERAFGILVAKRGCPSCKTIWETGA